MYAIETSYDFCCGCDDSEQHVSDNGRSNPTEVAAENRCYFGQLDAAFEMKSGAASFTLTLKLKLTNDKVTGEFASDHIGTGKISNGSWAANKLTLTIETSHGAMLLTGKLEKGKLTGQFNAGQMQGTWQANKK